MENATKALIIAGTILVTLIVVSLGVILFQKMANPVINEANSMTQQEIDQFNSKILPYIGEKISGSQVNVLIQYIFSLNNNKDTYNVNITFPSGGLNGTTWTTANKKVQTGKYYSVTASYSGGLITSVNVQARPDNT